MRGEVYLPRGELVLFRVRDGHSICCACFVFTTTSNPPGKRGTVGTGTEYVRQNLVMVSARATLLHPLWGAVENIPLILNFGRIESYFMSYTI